MQRSEAGPATGGPAEPVKLCVMYLGIVCGKHKYTLLEEEDIHYASDFTIEPDLQIDRNGTGGYIFVNAKSKRGEGEMDHLHNLLWINRFGWIQPGSKVVHRNGITVDNRVANLALVDVNTPMGVVPKVVTQTETESRFSGGDLYRLALSRLPDFETRQFEQSAERNGPPRQVEIYTTADGVQDHGAPLYECLHAACCNLELDGSSFVRCPSCSHARYCSDKCLDLDSTRHLKICSGGCGSQPCDALSGR